MFPPLSISVAGEDKNSWSLCVKSPSGISNWDIKYAELQQELLCVHSDLYAQVETPLRVSLQFG